MRPRDRQQHELHHDHVRSCYPIGEQRRCISGRNEPEDPARDPLGSKMTGEPERNAQTQYELRDFGDCVAKMPSLVERPQTEREMRRSRGVKRRVDDRNSPPPEVKL